MTSRALLADALPIDEWQRRRALQLRADGGGAQGGPGALRDDMPMSDWQRARNVQAGDVLFSSGGDNGLVGGWAADRLSAVDANGRPSRLPPMSERQWETEAGNALRPPPFTGTPAEWAERQVGRRGYHRWTDNAPDARGRMDNHLLPGLRGYGDPKCNQFVWDALKAGGVAPSRMAGGRIPLAKDWGDPKSQIGGYSIVGDAPRPGDVVSDGHHVGIYAPLPDGRPGTISAASPFSGDTGLDGGVVHNDWGFRGHEEGPVRIWRARPAPPPR